MRKRLLALLCALTVIGTSQSYPVMSQTNAAEKASGGTTYYISSKKGNNSNPGTSSGTPWETLDKLQNVNLGPGDSVMLECGSVFNGYIHLKDVRGTADKPIRIGSYGSGNKPVINCGGEGVWYQDYKKAMDNSNHRGKGYVSSAILLYDVDFVEISGLEITNRSDDFDYFMDGTPGLSKTADRMDRTGVAGLARNGGTMEHIYLNDLYIHNVDGNLQDKHMNNGGIQLNAAKPDNEASTGVARYEDVKITNCHVKDVSRAGIVVGYTYNHDKFSGAAIPDDVVKNYGHGRLLLEGNYVQDVGNDGIVAMYADRPVIQNNVSDGAGADLDDNYPGYWQSFCAAIWPWKCKNAVFQYNEAFDTVGEGNGDGQAWDVDWSDGTVYQYNYSHNNGGGAMLVCLDEAYRGTYRYNLSQNDLQCLITFQGNPEAKIYNNVFYIGGDLTTAIHHPAASKRGGAGYLANNIFYNVSSKKAVGSDANGNNSWNPGGNKTFENNIYYGYDEEGFPELPETDAITDDPMFVNPGSGPSSAAASIHGRDAFGGYKISDSSPAVNAGVTIGKGVSKDFFGGKVGMIPDIGIFETSVPEDVTLDVRSEIYDIEGEKITNIPKNTTVEKFIENISYSNGVDLKVMKASAELESSELIEDNVILKVINRANTSEEKSYTLYIKKEYRDYPVDGMTPSVGSYETSSPTEGGAALAFDDDLTTVWHTAWSGCRQDQIWFKIDMGASKDVAGLKYIPRQSGGVNGMFKKYEIYVSDDDNTWTKVANGTWEEGTTTKYAEFDTIKTRYVKLVGVENSTSVAGKLFGSAAEIRLRYVEEVE